MSQIDACQDNSWNLSHYLAEILEGRIDTRPKYQRNLVWSDGQKSRLIDSIIRGFPIPPIWLWQRGYDDKHRPLYSVIDGQQRLSTIVSFFHGDFRYKKDEGSIVDSQLADNAHGCGINPATNPHKFKPIPEEVRSKILASSIPNIVISGSNQSIAIEAFMRLNTTSSQLNAQELRNAVFEGEFKEFIYTIVAELEKDSYWKIPGRIFAQVTRDRMPREALTSAITASLIYDAPLHKDPRIDQCYKDHDKSFSRKKEIEGRLKQAITVIKRNFKHKSLQIFSRNQSDFYSLIRVIDELLQKRDATLGDKEEWSEAETNLRIFCERLETFRRNRPKDATLGSAKYDKLKKLYPVEASYWATVNGPQKEIGSRTGREMILRDILTPPWRSKPSNDPERSFNETVKDLAWVRASDNKQLTAKCAICKNTFERLQIEFDHIHPWSKGGSSSLQNCQILCVSCNKSKGDKK